MRKVFIISFRDQPQRHGGVKRSAQLNEALGELGASTICLKVPSAERLKSCFVRPFATARHCMRAVVLLLCKGVSLVGAIKYVLMAANAQQKLRELDPSLVYVETSAGQGILTMDVLRRMGVPYVAMPQNIEFMVPGRKEITFRNLGAKVNMEIEGYKNAIHVKTICEFDAAVLQCFGVDASEFFSYPDRRDEASYLAIELGRTRSKKSFYLVLGTANNPPTYVGMKRLVEELDNHSFPVPVVIAGFGTEKLPRPKNPLVSLLGSVDDKKLTSLLTECKGIIVRQPQTTGLLTKIAECNIANIPVFIIGSYIQAKGLEKSGIYCVESIAEIEAKTNDRFEKIKRPDTIELDFQV